jgi:hypothetical protein
VPLAEGAWAEGAPVAPAAAEVAGEAGAELEWGGAEPEGGAESPAPPY